MKKVLFISHNANRNGAPLMLLNMLKWLKENSDISFEILLRSTGSLQEEFSAIAPTFLYQTRLRPELFVFRFVRKFGGRKDQVTRHHQNLLQHFTESGIDLIYSNTFTNGDILETLAPLGCPVITHVHEMEGWIQQSGQENLKQVLKHTSHFITASNACRQNLIENHHISPDIIKTVHSFIPTRGIEEANPAGVKEQFNIPEEAYIVLGSGHEAWRKGKDLFVQLAAQVRQKVPEQPVHFIWVGGWLNEDDRRIVLHDMHHLGLEDRVHFTGEVSNPLDYFAAGDVFALVSREDTFPLVCLEAAALGKPVLCFQGSGGMPEFVEKDAGYILPYLDLEAMAEKIAELASNPERRHQLGNRAAEKVRERNDVQNGSRQIASILNRPLEPFLEGPAGMEVVT